jgi:hypothetical protein
VPVAIELQQPLVGEILDARHELQAQALCDTDSSWSKTTSLLQPSTCDWLPSVGWREVEWWRLNRQHGATGMKTLFKLASAILTVVSLNAQFAAVLKRFPAGSPEIEIQNNSTVNVTAFAVSTDPVVQADTSTGPFIIFIDAAIDTDRIHTVSAKGGNAGAPREKYVVPVTAGSVAACPISLNRHLPLLPYSKTGPQRVTQPSCHAWYRVGATFSIEGR